VQQRSAMAAVGRWRIAAAITAMVARLTSWALALAEGTPPPTRPRHLIVVIEENHSRQWVIGSKAASFLNHLAAYGSRTDDDAIAHPCLPNYATSSGAAPVGEDGHILTSVSRTMGAPGLRLDPYTHDSLPGSIRVASGLPLLGHAGDPAAATIPAGARSAQGGA
jgi:hypothetical protein